MTVDMLETLRHAIAATRNVSIAEVAPESRLEELGVDSLAITEIIVQVELELDDEFPVHLLRQLERIDTVGELADAMSQALLEAGSERGRPSTSAS